ncbi:hypothetical protein RQP46_010360 [Phenoliferia psychrophenolica]
MQQPHVPVACVYCLAAIEFLRPTSLNGDAERAAVKVACVRCGKRFLALDRSGFIVPSKTETISLSVHLPPEILSNILSIALLTNRKNSSKPDRPTLLAASVVSRFWHSCATRVLYAEVDLCWDSRVKSTLYSRLSRRPEVYGLIKKLRAEYHLPKDWALRHGDALGAVLGVRRPVWPEQPQPEEIKAYKQENKLWRENLETKSFWIEAARSLGAGDWMDDDASRTEGAVEFVRFASRCPNLEHLDLNSFTFPHSSMTEEHVLPLIPSVRTLDWGNGGMGNSMQPHANQHAILALLPNLETLLLASLAPHHPPDDDAPSFPSLRRLCLTGNWDDVAQLDSLLDLLPSTLTSFGFPEWGCRDPESLDDVLQIVLAAKARRLSSLSSASFHSADLYSGGRSVKLPTLDVAPRANTVGAVDLTVKAKGEHVYSAYKEDDKIHLCGSLSGFLDPSTESLYATLTTLAPDDRGKSTLKVVELFSPDTTVELKNTGIGTVNWEWSFVWEESLYFWRRQSASMLGPEKTFTLLVKPADKKFKHNNGDEVAIFTPGGKKGDSVQLLEYNLDRVDPPLKDKKAILAMITLLSFLDPLFNDAPPPTTPLDPRTEAYLSGRNGSPGDAGRRTSGAGEVSPTVVDPNEIEILDIAREAEYIHRALNLLEDKSLVYITLISRAPQLAGATIKFAEEVKRKRYKVSGEELKTFVQQGDPPQPPQPASAKKGYIPPPPPSSLKVFISRMDLGLNPAPKTEPWRPDLRPPIHLNSPAPTTPLPRPGAGPVLSEKAEKERQKLLKKQQKR